jgi:cbb3-type cytochrome oxidase maturation protein
MPFGYPYRALRAERSKMGLILAAAFVIGITALGILLWAMTSGQYDDPDGDAARILLDDEE